MLKNLLKYKKIIKNMKKNKQFAINNKNLKKNKKKKKITEEDNQFID